MLTQVAGLSYAEAAMVCEVPIGTIRSRVARARADLLDGLVDERETPTQARRRSSSASCTWPLLPMPLPPSIPSSPARSVNRPPASARITGIGPTS